MSQDQHRAETDDSDYEGTVSYRCPICKREYSNEILTRVHITRSEDDDHRNYNGFMPETTIECVDSEGKVLEEISKHPTDINVNSVAVDDLPDEFDDRKKRVLLVATYHPDIGSFTELHKLSSGVLEEHDLEPVTYNTARRWIREFYLPESEDTEPAEGDVTDSGTDSKRLEDFTPKQQDILITRLAKPEAPNTALAEYADCSIPYVGQVLTNAETVIESYSNRLEAGESLSELLRSELADETVDRLLEDGLLEELGVDIEIDNQQSPSDESAESPDSDLAATSGYAKIMSASPTEEPIAESENQNYSGGVNRTGETAESSTETAETAQETATDMEEMEHDVPSTEAESEADTEDEPIAVRNEEFSPDSRLGGVDGQKMANQDGSPEQDIPLAEIETLLEKVRFMRRILEREAETDSGVQSGRQQSQLAVINEIESRIENIIDN